jgi:type II secretory pathway pseudopilin PulG
MTGGARRLSAFAVGHGGATLSSSARCGTAALGCEPAAHRAFTVVELLVAVAILVITVVAVTEIFDLSSEAAGRTAAHAEVLGASAAVQQRVASLLSNIESGLLIIESPAPTGARADIAGGPAYFRLRHDRLVFIASAAPGEFQSYTDPRRGSPDNPTRAPANSSEALIYLGPGIPLKVPGLWPPASFENDSYMIPGAEWILAQRSILFVLDPPSENLPGWSSFLVNMDAFANPASGMLYRPPLAEGYQQSKMDIVVSSPTLRADAATFIDLFQRLPLNSLLGSANPAARSLWEPNHCPTTVSLAAPTATGGRDHYTRSGWNFQPHLADLRIDWTDGRDVLVDPDGNPGSGDEVYETRWFGLRPDPNSPSDLNNPAALAYLPVKRQGFTDYSSPAEASAFGLAGGTNRIEWANPSAGGSALNGAYRAVWRLDTWAFRPKALRFTYRVYDSGNRLKEPTDIDLNEDGEADPNADNPAIVPRWGKEFCIVIALP